jgi:predicted butyrate kinase (DUF1464 family)
MPCVTATGELTESARKILAAMERASPLSAVASSTGMPLYRVRSAARELAQAGLAAESQDAWQITATGRAALDKSLAAA